MWSVGSGECDGVFPEPTGANAARIRQDEGLRPGRAPITKNILLSAQHWPTSLAIRLEAREHGVTQVPPEPEMRSPLPRRAKTTVLVTDCFGIVFFCHPGRPLCMLPVAIARPVEITFRVFTDKIALKIGEARGLVTVE